MQPNKPTTEEWQQPTASTSEAPYQASTEPQNQEMAPAENFQTSDVPSDQTAPVSTDDVELMPPQNDADIPSNAPQMAPDEDVALVRWTGTEYIHHSRSALWFTLFAVVVVLTVLFAIFVAKSTTFAILVPVMAVALFVYVRRAPEQIQYILSRKGIYVNDKLFPYSTFKSFGVVSEAQSHSVVLTPRKRFQIGQTLYFPEEVGEQLVDMLAERLPMKTVDPDAIDRLLKKLHL